VELAGRHVADHRRLHTCHASHTHTRIADMDHA
jgi:hypothetical protein